MLRLLSAAVILLVLNVHSVVAQAPAVPRSQLGAVVQSVAGTTIDIKYRRPVARGRELFGALVPWDRVWTPSADTSAVFHTTRPIQVNGSTLEAGSYGFWTIPNASSWTIIFSRVPSVFHLRYPADQDAIRVVATPESGDDYVETLQFDFPMVDADSAVFRLRWGNTSVPMKIRSLQ